MDPSHAQALLSMMRGQLQPGHPALRPPQPPLDLTESPAKRQKRDSSSAEEAPVSPPPSAAPSSSQPAYLAQAAQAVYQGMLGPDPQAVWVMQVILALLYF